MAFPQVSPSIPIFEKLVLAVIDLSGLPLITAKSRSSTGEGRWWLWAPAAATIPVSGVASQNMDDDKCLKSVIGK